MPYRRYKRYGTKKSYRRKTIRKRMTYRRRRSTFSKPDGNHREKIVRVAYFTVGAGGIANQCNLTVHWLATGASANQDVYFTGGYDAGPPIVNNLDQQFNQCGTMYRSYKITGVRIEYRPNFIDAGNAGLLNMEPV